MVTLVAVTVLGQRISLPISTGVSLLLPLTLALLLVGLRLGVFEWERLRLGLYAACTGLAAFVALVNSGRGTGWSPTSLALLVALYLPLCCVVERNQRDRARTAALTTFVRLLTILAWASLLYLLLQVTGVVVYRDLVADVVPDALLNTGFNTANPFYYGSPYYRANGFVFLEPSFFSQALGLAVLSALHLRLPASRLFPMLAAMLATSAGTGVIVLVAGVAVLALSRRRDSIRSFAMPALGALIVLLLTPLGSVFASRALEGRTEGTSSSLRFALPFEYLVPRWQLDAFTMTFGAGPGAAERFVQTTRFGVELQSPALLKLLVDYGMIVAIAMTFFVCLVLLHGTATPPLAVAAVLTYEVLNSALLLPNIVVLSWVLVAVTPSYRHGLAPGPSEQDRAARLRGTEPGPRHAQGPPVVLPSSLVSRLKHF